MYGIFSLFIMLATLSSCKNENEELVTLTIQHDLFPEGIAIDEKSKIIYLNSLLHSKIMACNMDGSLLKTIATSKEHGYLPGFGMTIKGDTLFALGNSLGKKDSQSILLLINTKTGALINSFSPTDTTFKYLNDVAVGSDGDVFITDSESNKIYTISHSKKMLELYMESDGIANSNGIAISDDNKYLYLASSKKGIRIVEKQSKKIINTANMDFRGIDGMKYYKNSLVAIVNAKKAQYENGIYQFFLNKENNAIIRKEKLRSYGKEIKLPTTFSIVDGFMYFITNTQIDNLDENTSKVIDKKILEPYRLMKMKIDTK